MSIVAAAFHIFLSPINSHTSFDVLTSLPTLLLSLYVDDSVFHPFFVQAGQLLTDHLSAFAAPLSSAHSLPNNVYTSLLPENICAIVYDREITRRYRCLNDSILPLIFLQNSLKHTFTIRSCVTRDGIQLSSLNDLSNYCSDIAHAMIEETNSALNECLTVTAFIDVSHFTSPIFVRNTQHNTVDVASLIPHSLPLILQTCRDLLISSSSKNDHTLSQLLHLRLLRTSLVSFLGHTQPVIASLNQSEKDLLWPQIQEVYRHINDGLTVYTWTNPNLSKFVESCTTTEKRFDQATSFLHNVKKMYSAELSQKRALVSWEKPSNQISITGFVEHTKKTFEHRRVRMLMIDSKLAQIRAQTKLQSNRPTSLDEVYDTLDTESKSQLIESWEEAVCKLADDISTGGILFEIPMSLQSRISLDGSTQTNIGLIFPEVNLELQQSVKPSDPEQPVPNNQISADDATSIIFTPHSYMDTIVQIYFSFVPLHSSNVAQTAYNNISLAVQTTAAQVGMYKARFNKFSVLWKSNPQTVLTAILGKGHNGTDPIFPQIPIQLVLLSESLQAIISPRDEEPLRTSPSGRAMSTDPIFLKQINQTRSPIQSDSPFSFPIETITDSEFDLSELGLPSPSQPNTPTMQTKQHFPAPNASSKDFKSILSFLVGLMSETSQQSSEERLGCIVVRTDTLKRDLVEIVLSWLNPFEEALQSNLMSSLRQSQKVVRQIKQGFNTNFSKISFEEKLQIVHHFCECCECFDEITEYQEAMKDRIDFSSKTLSLNIDSLRLELGRFNELWETTRQSEWRLYSHQMRQQEESVLKELNAIHALHQTAVRHFLDQLLDGPGVPRKFKNGTALARSQLESIHSRLSQLEAEQTRIERFWGLFKPSKNVDRSSFMNVCDIVSNLTQLWKLIEQAEKHYESGVLSEMWNMFVANPEGRDDRSILLGVETITLPSNFTVVSSFRAKATEDQEFVDFIAQLASHPLSSLDWESIITIFLRHRPNKQIVDVPNTAKRFANGDVVLSEHRRLFSLSAVGDLKQKLKALKRRDEVWAKVKEMLDYYHTFTLPQPRSVFLIIPTSFERDKQFTIQINDVDQNALDMLRSTKTSSFFPRYDARVMNWLLFVGKRDAEMLCSLLKTDNTAMMRSELDVLMFVVNHFVIFCEEIRKISSFLDEAATLEKCGVGVTAGVSLTEMNQALSDSANHVQNMTSFASKSLQEAITSLSAFRLLLSNYRLSETRDSANTKKGNSSTRTTVLVKILRNNCQVISGSSSTLSSVETTHNDTLAITQSTLPFPSPSECLSFPQDLRKAIKEELRALTLVQINAIRRSSFVPWLMNVLHDSITHKPNQIMQIFPLVVEEWFSSAVSLLTNGLASEDASSAFYGFIHLMEDLNTSLTYLMTLQRCGDLTMHSGHAFNSLIGVLGDRLVRNQSGNQQSSGKGPILLDSDYYWLPHNDFIAEDADNESGGHRHHHGLNWALAEAIQKTHEKEAHTLISLFIRLLLSIRRRALTIQSCLLHAQVLQIEIPETVLPVLSSDDVEMVANDLPLRTISQIAITDLTRTINRALHVQFDPETNAFTHPFSEADVSLDQLDPWVHVDHGFDIIPGLSSFPSLPSTTHSTWLESTLRMAYIDANSGVFSIGGVCMLCTEETYDNMHLLLGDFAHSLGENLRIIPCSSLTWHTTIQHALFDAVCEGSFVLFDKITSLAPSTLTLLADWLETIQEFRKKAALSTESTIVFELDRLRKTVSLPLKFSFISTTVMQDTSINHNPLQIRHVLRCLAVENVPAHHFLTPLLFEQGFCFAETLAKTWTEFTDAMLAVILTRLSDFSPQTKVHLSSVGYLSWVAQTAGDYLRLYLIELRNQHFPSDRHPRVDLISQFDLLLHSPSCLCAPHLFTNTDSFDAHSEQAHRAVEMEAMKATVNYFLTEVWLPLAVNSHNHNLYENSDKLGTISLPRISEILTRLVESFFPSAILVDSKEANGDQTPSYLLQKQLETNPMEHDLIPIATQVVDSFRKDNRLSSDTVQLSKALKTTFMLERNSILVLQGQPGSGKNTVLSLAKVIYETKHQITIRILNTNHTDSLANLTEADTDVDIHHRLLYELQHLSETSLIESTGKSLLETWPIHTDPSTISTMFEDVLDESRAHEADPVWLVFKVRTMNLPKQAPVTIYSLFGYHFQKMGEYLLMTGPDESEFLLPRHSRLIIQIEAPITRIPIQLSVSRWTISVSQPSTSVAFRLYESWARSASEMIESDQLYATVATLRSITPTLFSFLQIKAGSVVHSMHGRLKMIGCVQTVTTLMSSLITLHSKFIRTTIDSKVMTLYLAFSVTWGFLGHLCFPRKPKVGFPEWHRNWMKENKEFECNEDTFMTRQALLMKDVAAKESSNRRTSPSFDCNSLIHQLFPDARFFKSGSVFDFVPDPVSKEFVHHADLEPSHSIFGPAHRATTSFGFLQNYMPFLQLVFPTLLLAYAGRPTIILDDFSLKGSSCTKLLSAVVAHTLSEVEEIDTASAYICPHSKHYPLNIHFTPDKFNHTVTAQIRRLIHPFTDSVFVSRCPFAPLVVNVTPSPRDTTNGHPNVPDQEPGSSLNAALSAFVNFSTSQILETSHGNAQMIGRNPTIISIKDRILFDTSSEPTYTTACGVFACHPPSVPELADLFLNVWKVICPSDSVPDSPVADGPPTAESTKPTYIHTFVCETVIPTFLHMFEQIREKEVFVCPTVTSILNGLQTFCQASQKISSSPDILNQMLLWEVERVFCYPQQSMTQFNQVQKLVRHSIHLFTSSLQSYDESRENLGESEVEQDKLDTLFEIRTVQSGVQMNVYSHPTDSIPPFLAQSIAASSTTFSTMLASCSILCLSPDYLKQVLQLSETILTTSEPLIVFSHSPHSANMMIKAVSTKHGLFTRQTQLPYSPRTVKPFLDVLADFIVECGASSLTRDISFLSRMQDRSSLERKIITSYHFTSPIVPTPQESYFSPQPPILINQDTHYRPKEGLFELQFKHASKQYQQYVFLLQYILQNGQAPIHLRLTYDSLFGEERDDFDIDSFDSACLYLFRRMAWELEKKGRKGCSTETVQALIWHAAEHSQILIHTHPSYTIDLVRFLGPLTAFSDWFTVPSLTKEIRESVASSIISPLFNRLPDMWSTQGHSDEPMMLNDNEVLMDSTALFTQRTIETVSELFDRVTLFTHKQGPFRTAFGCSESDPNLGLDFINEPSAGDFVEFVQYFSHFVLLFNRYEEIHTKELVSTLTSVFSFPTKAKLLQGYLSHVQLNSRLHDPREMITDRLTEIETDISSLNTALSELKTIEQSFPLSTSLSVDLIGLEETLERAYASLVTITVSGLDDLRDIHLSSSFLRDIYNMLLELVFLDEKQSSSARHSAHVLQAMWEFDVTTQPLKKMIDLQCRLHSIAPESQLPTYPPIILLVWHWIDDTAQFRIGYENRTQNPHRKRSTIVKSCALRNRQQKIRNLIESLENEKKGLMDFLESPNLSERMEQAVEKISEEMRMIDGLSQLVKDLNDSVTNELSTLTILRRELVTCAMTVAATVTLLHRFLPKPTKQFFLTEYDPLINKQKLPLNQTTDIYNILSRLNHNVFADKSAQSLHSSPREMRNSFRNGSGFGHTQWQPLSIVLEQHGLEGVSCCTQQLPSDLQALLKFAPRRDGDSCITTRQFCYTDQLKHQQNPIITFTPDEQVDFLAFNGPHELATQLFLRILFASGFFFLMYVIFPLTNPQFSDLLHPNPTIPFIARVRAPMIYDRMSVFTGFQQKPSRDMPNLFSIYAITNPQSSPNVISLKSVHALQRIHDMLKSIADQTAPPPPSRAPFGARSQIGMPKMLRKRESKLQLATVKKASEIRLALILTDVGENTMTKEVAEILVQYANSKTQRLSTLFMSKIHIGNDFSSNLFFSLTVPVPSAETSTYPATVTYTLPFSFDLILVASKDDSAQCSGLWFEHTYPIPIVPTESTFKTALYTPTHCVISATTTALAPKNAQNEITTLVKRMASLREAQKTMNNFFSTCLRNINHFVNDRYFPFMALPHSTLHDPVKLSLRPSHHFHPLTNTNSIFDSRSQSTLNQSGPPSEFGMISKHESVRLSTYHSTTQLNTDNYYEMVMSPQKSLSGEVGLDTVSSSHSLGSRHTVTSIDASNLDFLLTGVTAHSTVPFADDQNEILNMEVNEVLPSCSIYSVVLSLSSHIGEELHFESTLKQLRTWLLALMHSEQEWRNTIRHFLQTYEWEESNIWPFIEIASIMSFGYLRIHSMPFGQDSPALWNRQTFESVVSVASAIIQDADDTAWSFTFKRDSRIKRQPSRPPSQILTPRSPHSTPQKSTNTLVPSLPIRVISEIVELIATSFVTLIQQTTSSMSDYYAFLLHTVIQFQIGDRSELSSIEKSILFTPLTVCLHSLEDASNASRQAMSPVPVAPRSALFAELIQLQLPLQAGVLQAAGLMPLNPVSDWLPSHAWKNAFTLAAICPLYRSFILDLHPAVASLFVIIDHIPVTNPKEEDVVYSLLFPVASAGVPRAVHDTITSSFDREAASLIADSLFDAAGHAGMTQTERHLHRQNLLDGIVRSMRQKTKQEQNRTKTDFQTEQTFHGIDFEELMEHDVSAFDSSSPHRSASSPNAHQWKVWMSTEANHLHPMPSRELSTISILQRLLFSDALLLPSTNTLVTVAITKSPLLGNYASLFDRSSLTMGQQSNYKTLRTRPFPYVFVHSEAFQTLLQNSYNMHDRTYTPGKQFFRVVLLFFQNQPYSTSIPMNDVSTTLSVYASKINHRVTRIKCSLFARQVMTEDCETDQVLGQMGGDELWARAWRFAEATLTELWEEHGWIIVEGLEKTSPEFVRSFSMWTETHFLDANDVEGESTSILWIFIPDGTREEESSALNSLSPRVCQSTRMTIRQATTLRTSMLASLTATPSIVPKETRLKVVRYYDPHAQRTSVSYRSMFFLWTAISALQATIASYVDTLLQQNMNLGMVIDTFSIPTMMNLISQPGLVDRPARPETASRRVDAWNLGRLKDSMIKRAYGYLLGTVNASTFMNLANQIIPNDALFSEHSVALVPGLAPPSSHQFVTSIAAVLKQMMSLTMSEREIEQYLTGSSAELEAVREHSERTRAQIAFREVLNLNLDFIPFMKTDSSLVYDLTHNPGNVTLSSHHALAYQRAFAVGSGDVQDVAFRVQLVYHPFVLTRMWKESAMLIQREFPSVVALSKLLVSTFMSESAIPLHMVVLLFDLAFTITQIDRIMTFGSALPIYLTVDKTEAVGADVTASNPLLFTSFTLTVQDELIPQMMWMLGGFSTENLQIWSNFGRGRVPVHFTSPSQSGLAQADSPLRKNNQPRILQWLNQIMSMWKQSHSFANTFEKIRTATMVEDENTKYSSKLNRDVVTMSLSPGLMANPLGFFVGCLTDITQALNQITIEKKRTQLQQEDHHAAHLSAIHRRQLHSPSSPSSRQTVSLSHLPGLTSHTEALAHTVFTSENHQAIFPISQRDVTLHLYPHHLTSLPSSLVSTSNPASHIFSLRFVGITMNSSQLYSFYPNSHTLGSPTTTKQDPSMSNIVLPNPRRGLVCSTEPTSTTLLLPSITQQRATLQGMLPLTPCVVVEGHRKLRNLGLNTKHRILHLPLHFHSHSSPIDKVFVVVDDKRIVTEGNTNLPNISPSLRFLDSTMSPRLSLLTRN
ncbi:hypothetical protein BLNAU_1595 [Blattamonas nauphoetae]|uniref:Uncharacterized protein n=1 Tax=Blattamonas nauphoetae TaxID=2049346 RepID=A0ABQ9YII8_9EUKA|nr:hypothetical protein BLNAU_1595 [Blattamonas nauphoetae]